MRININNKNGSLGWTRRACPPVAAQRHGVQERRSLAAAAPEAVACGRVLARLEPKRGLLPDPRVVPPEGLIQDSIEEERNSHATFSIPQVEEKMAHLKSMKVMRSGL